jgi:tryptophan synthase beta chain
MASDDRYFAGQLEDFSYPEEAIRTSLAKLPKVA